MRWRGGGEWRGTAADGGGERVSDGLGSGGGLDLRGAGGEC